MPPMILESTIEGWRFKNILLEAHCLAPNLVASLPPHSHEEYQINLAINYPGEYLYRGAFYPVPPASVSVLHLDEVHSGSDIGVRDTPSVFRVLYIPPSLMQQVAEDLTGCKIAISVGTLNVLWELLLQNISSRRNYRPSKSKS